jgi:endonuclease/exonuclease/phosphatase family metal-dependent hydrolase
MDRIGAAVVVYDGGVRRRQLLLGGAAGLMLACDRRDAARPASESVDVASPPARRERLRVLTYNVLADEVALERRIPALLRVMERAAVDVLALQEVAPWFLDWIAGSRWLREYEIATIDGRPARPNGQLIVSRLPILQTRARQLSGGQGRTVLISRLSLGAGEHLCVATTHMESFLEDGPVRAQQLDEIFAELRRERDDPAVVATLFAGDLNFGDGEPETAQLDSDFVDLWTLLHPETPGFTWDIEHSEMARAGSFVGEPSRRLDRAMLRSKVWVPKSIEIIGDTPVVPGDRRLFPSDHFGLVAELVRR